MSAFRNIFWPEQCLWRGGRGPHFIFQNTRNRIIFPLKPLFRDIRLMLFLPALAFNPCRSYSPSSYEPIFFEFILHVLAVPCLRGESSSVRKDEGAPVQCILRIGCPCGGFRSEVVGKQRRRVNGHINKGAKMCCEPSHDMSEMAWWNFPEPPRLHARAPISYRHLL